MRIAGLCVVLAALSLIGACDLFEEQIDVLDAAQIYEENPEAFERVRERFPGPFTEARRIPAFDDADNRLEDISFLEDLKETIPVEVLQLGTWGEGGPDVMRVVVGTDGLSVSGSLVSLIFFESFKLEEILGRGVEVFDKCDSRALDWLQMANKIGFADVYCRLDDNWYAYQAIT
jgi:hypothetical protein